MRRFAAKILFFLAASPSVWRAARRLRRRRDERFDGLADRMRLVDGPHARWLQRPEWLAATAERWLPLLKPRGFGPCFAHSLWLLDLWSRCGLDPVLHLGTRAPERAIGTTTEGALEASKAREFHAWITTGEAGPRTSDRGHQEIWRG
jgi:hypothetical protein